MSNVPFIFEYEMEALLDALRRDLRAEQEKALRNTNNREWHTSNVRLTMRLLEALNPRRPERQTYRQIVQLA